MMTERKFSPKCGKCRQRAMAIATVPYDLQIDHDGRKYQVSIPALSVPRCRECGEISIDSVASKAIDDAFRMKAGLLTPEEIRSGRHGAGYANQQEFADCFGVAVATVSRWETGAQVQQRFHNDMLKAFFEVPEFRHYLEKIHGIKRKADPDVLDFAETKVIFSSVFNQDDSSYSFAAEATHALVGS